MTERNSPSNQCVECARWKARAEEAEGILSHNMALANATTRRAMNERNEIIRKLRERHSAIEIADMVGLTRQRVHQILNEAPVESSAETTPAERGKFGATFNDYELETRAAQKTADLAPCPFCSSTDFDLARKPDPSPPTYPGGVWVIECGGCGALGPFCEERENAPKAWNDCKRRPGVETKPARDADHCDFPDCEQHNTLEVSEAATLLTHSTYSDFSSMGHDVWHERRRAFLKRNAVKTSAEDAPSALDVST